MNLRGACFLVDVRKIVYLALLCVLGLVTVTTASAAQGGAVPLVATYTSGQMSLDEILAGAAGEATLLYYISDAGPEKPTLIVRLTKEDGASDAMATIFDVPPAMAHVPVKFMDGYPVVPDTLSPTITFVAHQGWWVRDRLVNFDLDIQVNGPIMTMWASGGDRGWSSLLSYGEPNARIIVRDTDGDGLPDWDWRTMLPEFPDRADYRTTYAERKCATPLRMDEGPLSAWPFVAANSDYGFEQKTGILRPPIVVDWEAGRVRIFSEIVTLRNQNCTYGMHSIERVLPGQLNSPNFEVPFAFYDLSGEGVGYPNLLLRTQRHPENDRWLGGGTAENQRIRYSWRNDVGNWHWDYKIDVMGFHPNTSETPIADGAAFIDAPSYEEFPNWVISKAWPVATFIDTEGTYFRSSEGIYEWSSSALGLGYLLGRTDKPSTDSFSTIQEGFRGEFRYQQCMESMLYLSPLDNRLHLLGAEAGLWNLGDRQSITVRNVNGDHFLDLWVRHHGVTGSSVVSSVGDLVGANEMLEALFVSQQQLFYFDRDSIYLTVTTDLGPLLELAPPSDHDSWQSFRTAVEPFDTARRDPSNLHSWFEALSNEVLDLTSASLLDIEAIPGGFALTLALEDGFSGSLVNLLNLASATPGNYRIEYDGQFHTYPVSIERPRLLAEAISASGQGSEDLLVRVSIQSPTNTCVNECRVFAAWLGDDYENQADNRTKTSVPCAGRNCKAVLYAPVSGQRSRTLKLWAEDSDGELIDHVMLEPSSVCLPADKVSEDHPSPRGVQGLFLGSIGLCTLILIAIGLRSSSSNIESR